MTVKPFKWPPSKEAEFHDWEINFITVLEIPVNLAAAGVPTGKMTILTGLQSTYHAKYALAPPHSRAGKPANTARKTAKKAYLSGAGGIRKIIAQYIKGNDAVSDELKMQLRLMPADTILTANTQRSGVTIPNMQVKSNSVGTVTFIFHADGSPIGSGKEVGMQRCEAVYCIGTVAPATPDDCNKTLAMQKSPHTEDFGVAKSRQSIYGWPYWVDTRGKKRNYGPMFTCIIT
ncbi:MAG TPA: hypothetical protein VF411_15585 [Bacteroidia bacterium]